MRGIVQDFRNRRLNIGLSEAEVALVKSLLKPLTAAGPIWGFGSRAREDHQPFSDLDLQIAGKPDRAISRKVREAFEESRLPIRVDLVLDAELSEAYRSAIEAEKKRFC